MRLSKLSNNQLRRLLRESEVRFANDDEESKKVIKFLMQYMKAVRNKFDVYYSQLSRASKNVNMEMEWKKFDKAFTDAYFSLKRLREKF